MDPIHRPCPALDGMAGTAAGLDDPADGRDRLGTR
jgi:hypothetical protein